MQRRINSDTTDPKALDLKQHSIHPVHTSGITAGLLSVTREHTEARAISFDSEDSDNALCNEESQWRGIDDELDMVENFELCSGQAHSAPTQFWSFDSYVTQPASPYSRDEGPWDPLQGLATSAPWSNPTSSWPSNSLDPATFQATNSEFSNLNQLSGVRRRQLESVHWDHNNISNVPLPNVGHHETRKQPWHYHRPESLLSVQQHNASGSASSESSSLVMGDLDMEEDFVGIGEPKSRIADDIAPGDVGSTPGFFNEFYDISQDPLSKSWQPLPPGDPNVLDTFENSWQRQQQHSLASVGRHFEDATHRLHETASTAYRRSLGGDRDWAAELLQNPTRGFENHQHNDTSNHLDHPNAIRIKPCSDHYQSDLTSTFPPTAGFFPDNLPSLDLRRRRVAPSTTRHSVSPPNQINIPFRRRPRATTVGSLSIIREDGQRDLPMSRTASQKGRRKGPLAKETAAAAAQRRKEKSVCIRCRTMKQTCKNGTDDRPCDGCRENSKAKLWDQPCTKADFFELIKLETCNRIFQRCISHSTLDRRCRLTLHFSGDFQMAELLAKVNLWHSGLNINVCHSSGSTYTIDLAKCLKVLTKVNRMQQQRTYDLRDIAENKLLSVSEWLECMRDCSGGINPLDRSIIFNNMPSRNSYSFVPRGGATASQPLDIENEDDREAILIAVQLCRILLRALEVEAFKTLQKSVNDLAKGSKPGKDVEILADQLLKILLSLRWRIAWWVVTGDGSNSRNDLTDRFTERVTRLAQVLYCYYFIAKKRLPSSGSEFSNGKWSDYADAGPVWEDLPDVDSIDGFRAWMLRGQELIRSANIPQRLSSYPAFVSPSAYA